jgi:hypothetical protein
VKKKPSNSLKKTKYLYIPLEYNWLLKWLFSIEIYIVKKIIFILFKILFYQISYLKQHISWRFFLIQGNLLESIFYGLRWVNKTPAVPDSYKKYTPWLELETCYADLKLFTITLHFLRTIFPEDAVTQNAYAIGRNTGDTSSYMSSAWIPSVNNVPVKMIYAR